MGQEGSCYIRKDNRRGHSYNNRKKNEPTFQEWVTELTADQTIDWRAYDKLKHYVFPILGEKLLEQVDCFAIAELLLTWQKKEVMLETMQELIRLTHQTIDYAVERGLLLENLCTSIGGNKPKLSFLSVKDQSVFKQIVVEDRHNTGRAAIISMNTGLPIE
ncbi:hypothetical protein JZO70_17375 [Enterococcus sp. 669A]|uniref:Uncharacterized protein n=1 Tax=Candidatus Enterococcus moelleringii TaxID=2815325 RepID=A0ABS3LEA4_9ENTE|nr:hypothetical protein [Enterococcus sp. 669A]MBO1307949.1 hypothetical protein [Enterococcus sp. 669A]